MIEQNVEFFYGETVRWSFGFDNPNKAAVIFACLLPVLFYGWNAGWSLRRIWLRSLVCVPAAVAFLLAAYCLCMTFSRGALVASVLGLGYVAGLLLYRERGRPLVKWLAHILLFVTFAFLIVWTGMGTRTGEAAEGDRSVGNRFDLWSGALQMSVENPRGFGAGRSGMEYMQWYQATDREEGYRTMVNSYLTFLVERGWALSVLILIVFVCFWVWTAPGREDRFQVGLRGSLVAFLAAGIFSTTMEDWRLWILPSVAAAGMVGMRIHNRQRLRKPMLAVSLGVAGVCVCVLVWKGWSESYKDPLRREFGPVAGGRSVSVLMKKGGERPTIAIVPDPRVLGDYHGKLLRELVLGGDMGIKLGADAASSRRMMLVGRGVNFPLPDHVEELVLLSPEIVGEAALESLAGSNLKVLLIVGEIDEDGRTAFWREAAEREGWEVSELLGVGTRVDWAWEELPELLGELIEPGTTDTSF